MTGWTASGTSEKARFQGGMALLASIFSGPYDYTADSLTAEKGRVAAEVYASGTLINDEHYENQGEHYENQHLFMFRIRDGLIASDAEHPDTVRVREKLVPLLLQIMGKTGS
ncbi:MAG: ketosteroid isomerase [Rhizomicrobium sp.]